MKAAVRAMVGTALFLGGILAPALAPPQPSALPEPVVDVFRGVNANHPDIALAAQGIARAPGGHSNPYWHIAGDTDSIFTSWTTSLSEAQMRADLAGPGGVVLRDKLPRSRVQALSPQRGFLMEEELLCVGEIRAEVFERR
jgi:hypothetical protein